MAVERYIYFPASRRQFGSKSKALLELRRDETPQSGMLMTALSVLLRTHRRTFRVLQESGGIESAGYQSGKQPPWDVRQVLQQERKQASPADRLLHMHAAMRSVAETMLDNTPDFCILLSSCAFWCSYAECDTI